IYSGVIFMTSAGNPERRSAAKRKIMAAFLGTILLLGFYILINEINPDLLQVSLEEPEEIEYPPLPAGPYICNFDFPGLDAILTDYINADTGIRNDAIQLFHNTLKEQDSDKYCMEIKTPKNIDSYSLYLSGSMGNYFVIPELDEGTATYNYGIILFDEEDGLRNAKTSGDGVRCVVSTGEVSGGEIDTGFYIRSVAPVRLKPDEEETVLFYEGFSFNQDDEPKNNDYSGGALKELSVPLAPGTTEYIVTEADLEGTFVCDMMAGFLFITSDKYHCGIRSFAVGEPAPVVAVFKTNDDFFKLCNITNTDRGDLSTLLPGSTVKGNDDLEGLTQVFKFNEVHLIKGYLMDSER
ncbi:MAG: hypothetical protein PF549_00595, partial [Patescibacteria group bacterium]|nr:hypothetical protein [Patescibacteria group bacterium]